MDYLLKLYEYLTFEEYIESLHSKDSDIKRGQQKTFAAVDKTLKNLIPAE